MTLFPENCQGKRNKMKCNIHPLEREMRIIFGAIVTSLAFWGPSNKWFLLGLILFVTGIIGWCPPYALFGINTCKKKK